MSQNFSGNSCYSHGLPVFVVVVVVVVVLGGVNDLIVCLGSLEWEMCVAFPGETSCDRAALPNLPCTLGVSVFP